MARGAIMDEALRRAVEEELEWEPSVDARHIGVVVEGGSVSAVRNLVHLEAAA
jgi:osmotically-inducible protein OsmY